MSKPTIAIPFGQRYIVYNIQYFANNSRGQNQGSKKATLQSYSGMAQQKRINTKTAIESAIQEKTTTFQRYST